MAEFPSSGGTGSRVEGAEQNIEDEKNAQKSGRELLRTRGPQPR